MESIRSYSELVELSTLEERFAYLSLKGRVGDITHGGDRWVNQRFYTSFEWRELRHFVISRDMGCELGVSGYEIHDAVHIHHMNPMTREQLANGDEAILDPEYLICCSPRTHNAIHYSDERHLPRQFVERKPGDTTLW